MAAAVIGFLGVLAGALLTNWLNHQEERARLRRSAIVGAQMIAAELESAAIELQSGAQEDEWWSGELTTEHWRTHRNVLAEEVGPELIRELAAAYQLIEAWNREWREPRPEKPAPKLREELTTQSRQVKCLAMRLKKAVRRRPVGNKAAAAISLVGTVILIVALGYAALVSRPVTSDTSIARALDQKLSGKQVVYCSQAADRWFCNVSYAHPRLSTCQVGAKVATSSSLLVARPVDSGSGSCRHPRKPTKFVVAKGNDGLEEAPRAPSAARQALADLIQPPGDLKREETSLFTQLVNKIRGR